MVCEAWYLSGWAIQCHI